MEQTRDFTQVRSFLNNHGMNEEIVEPGCWLMAWWSGEPIGVVTIETVIDAAVMRALMVTESRRGRGVGTALVAAARDAAHARGARRLYALVTQAEADYLRRFSFADVTRADLTVTLTDTAIAERMRASPEKFAAHTALCLNLAHYREIIR
ncbi:MAG: GNAT family N-acetyltransferase [Candidatus Binataceae bacterium]